MYAVEIIVNHVAGCKKRARKSAAAERRKLHIAIKQIAVYKRGEVKHTHAAPKSSGVQIDKSAVLEIASVKFFISQINVCESYPGCVQPDNFIVSVDVIIYLARDFSWSRDMV